MSFNKTLKQFKRKSEIEIDCGDGFIVTVRQASRHNQEFRARAIQFTDSTTTKKGRKRVRVAPKLGEDSLTGTNDPKKDAEFFYNVFVVNWRGLKDDKGADVPPSLETAVELFGAEEGQILMELILAEAVKDTNFIMRDGEEREIAGESQPSSAT